MDDLPASFEHWRLALGMSYVDVDGRVVKPPFPVMHWLWNSIKVAGVSAAAVIDWLSLRSHLPASRNRANDCRAVTGKHEAQGRLPISEVEPIELAMELLFDFLSTLEFRPRLLNIRIARKSF